MLYSIIANSSLRVKECVRNLFIIIPNTVPAKITAAIIDTKATTITMPTEPRPSAMSVN